MVYKWTKKRKRARNKLIRLIILFILLTFVNSITNPVLKEGFNYNLHPISAVILVILVLIGCAQIADDIMILCIDSEDDD